MKFWNDDFSLGPDPIGLIPDDALVCRLGDRDRLEDARHYRDAGGRCAPPRGELVAQLVECLARWPDERDARGGARGGNLGLLRQKAIAGVERLGAGGRCRLDDSIDAQVAFRGRRRPNVHRLVGQADVQRIGVRIGVDGHRFDAQLAVRADYADGNLAAVGDKDPLERRRVFAQRH